MASVKNYILGFSLLGTMVLAIVFVSMPKDLSPSTTESTTLLPSSNSIIIPDIETYSDEAAAIVIGTVKEVAQDADHKGLMHAQLEVEEVLKGDPSSKMMVVDVQGGWSEQNKKILTSSEMASLAVGERVLLFLWVDSNGVYRIYAGAAGKCVVDPAGNVSGEAVFTMPLNDLKAKIKTALQN